MLRLYVIESHAHELELDLLEIFFDMVVYTQHVTQAAVTRDLILDCPFTRMRVARLRISYTAHAQLACPHSRRSHLRTTTPLTDRSHSVQLDSSRGDDASPSAATAV